MADIIISKQDAAQVLRLAFDDGTKSLRVTGSAVPGSMTVDQADGSLLHVTVDESALPQGAATEAKQDDEIAALGDIELAVQQVETAVIDVESAIVDVQSAVTSFGAKTSSSLVSEPFDSQTLTYVASGNGVGEIETVVYKLGVTTVATLTLSYDVQNRLTGVVRT